MYTTKLIATGLLVASFAISSFAEKKEGLKDVKYRRSSLHTILIEAQNFPNKETIINAYNNAPFPEKYNNHTISAKTIDPSKYVITDEDRAAAGIKQSGGGKLLKGVASSLTAGIVDTNARDIPLIVERYFKENKVANDLVAKWFDRAEDGSFDMDLIGKRGYYDASEMQANIAKRSARGTSSLADAGEELINNTFVVVSKLNFVTNEIVAAKIRDAAKSAASKLKNAIAQTVALKAADVVYNKTKEGYSVWTTSYLYQLNWNDSIAAVFYNDLWMDKSNIDSLRKEAFDKTDLFELKYIGSEHSSSLVTFSLKKEQRTEDQILELSTVRNIDAVYAKLQKKYDVFKTKTPLYSGFPITAKIGMKEGLEGGEKFEVLEQVLDPKTGLTKYVNKGSIKVDKKSIWDNRYNVGEEEDPENAPVHVTTFKGGKKFYSGMLIRQLN